LKEAWAGFWDATMSPAFKEWRDFWTWQLLTEFENEADIRSERVRLAYDMSTVSALQEDVDAIQNRARASFQAKIISQNEARSALGYAAVPGGDDAYYSAAPPAPQVAPPKRATAPIATKASRTTVEKRMQRELARYLSGEYDRAADAVEG
jgi:hypothetical protein